MKKKYKHDHVLAYAFSIRAYIFWFFAVLYYRWYNIK